MENLFKVGCNFDFALIDKAKELNDKYKGKAHIKEWFGSDSSHAETAARPNWRLQDISKEHLKEFVKRSKDAGIVFNWTMNSINPYGSKVELFNHKKEIQDFVKELEDIGVYRITFANPMLAMMIREVSNIELEASCILHLDSVSQMKYLHETLGVNKFCNNLMKNRNKKFLENAAKYCKENGCIIELLNNEFCYNNGVDKNGQNYAAPCVYRDSCYICHGSCKTKEETMCYNNYPMQFCMGSRNGNREGWLRSRWIRPQDLHYYNDLGINYFKISGRTGGTDAIVANMEAYMSGKISGNLLSLWKPLQSIYNGKSEKETNDSLTDYIDIEKLDGFLDHWFETPEGFHCEDEICGQTCTYCHDFYEKITSSENDKYQKIRENAMKFLPNCFKHTDLDLSVKTIDDGTIVQSDSISDTFIKKNQGETISFIHCDHFGIKTKEDFERVNRECTEHFIAMRNKCDNKETSNEK